MTSTNALRGYKHQPAPPPKFVLHRGTVHQVDTWMSAIISPFEGRADILTVSAMDDGSSVTPPSYRVYNLRFFCDSGGRYSPDKPKEEDAVAADKSLTCLECLASSRREK